MRKNLLFTGYFLIPASPGCIGFHALAPAFFLCRVGCKPSFLFYTYFMFINFLPSFADNPKNAIVKN